MRPGFGLIAGVIVSATLTFAGHAEALSGRASVIDGDSIVILGERIRILDIDAPESAQFCFKKSEAFEDSAWHCGREAALALSDWLGQQIVTCDTTGRGVRKGWLARCTAAGQDIAEWLAANGWAVPYRNCKCDSVRDASHDARAAQLGIWSSAFTPPWEWRKAH
jgi:endonuclease YncB( thermonuclease family)